MRLRALAVSGALALAGAAPTRAQAAPVDVPARTAEATRELESAAAPSPRRTAHAARARELFLSVHAVEPSWRSAGGIALAENRLGRGATASGWYWLASDLSDYSEAYLAWQRAALAEIFEGRAAVTLDLSRPAKAVRIDDHEIPAGAFDRALALDPGEHTIDVDGADGGAGSTSITVGTSDVGRRRFHPVAVRPQGWVDPAELGPAPKALEPSGGLGAIQIVTIVGTVTLATGIAIGGGYLLFGEENPRGLDSPEGAVIISTEILLIAAGTVIALVSD